MRPARAGIWALSALLLLCGSAQPAHAYYDDVHYALTYYIARQTGYTARQAHRIASACSMTDWDEDTEPVQSGGQVALVFTPFTGRAQNPRVKFHAFRRETRNTDVIGDGEDATIARGDVRRQLDALFKASVDTTKNPGVFLHAFQDQVPHGGYGAAWGHNPLAPDVFALYKSRDLPIGSSTDWVDYRPADVEAVCGSTHSYLTRFMNRISPYQYARPHYEHEYSEVVKELAAVNPAPLPINNDLYRMMFIRYYASKFDIAAKEWDSLVDFRQLDKLAAELGAGPKEEELEKHRSGPSISSALLVINEALHRAGMPDQVPTHHLEYDLDSDGDLADASQIDQWVLVGSLKLVTRGIPTTATLKMTVRDAAGKPLEKTLFGLKPVVMQPGVPYTWNDLPIGDLIVEFKRPDGTVFRKPVALTRRENGLDPIFVGNPAPRPAFAKPTIPATATGNFTGEWETKVGRLGYARTLTLTQSGTEVTGSYVHASGSGTVKGTVTGNTLKFSWTEGGVTDLGELELTAGGKEFYGWYDMKGKLIHNPWRGKRK